MPRNIPDDFRELVPDPRTGQLFQPKIGPYAGPVITPDQWMSQHPYLHLANMFANLAASMMTKKLDYTDPYQPPKGVSNRRGD